jgi:hypothetical protein
VIDVEWFDRSVYLWSTPVGRAARHVGVTIECNSTMTARLTATKLSWASRCGGKKERRKRVTSHHASLEFGGKSASWSWLATGYQDTLDAGDIRRILLRHSPPPKDPHAVRPLSVSIVTARRRPRYRSVIGNDGSHLRICPALLLVSTGRSVSACIDLLTRSLNVGLYPASGQGEP